MGIWEGLYWGNWLPGLWQLSNRTASRLGWGSGVPAAICRSLQESRCCDFQSEAKFLGWGDGRGAWPCWRSGSPKVGEPGAVTPAGDTGPIPLRTCSLHVHSDQGGTCPAERSLLPPQAHADLHADPGIAPTLHHTSVCCWGFLLPYISPHHNLPTCFGKLF